MRLIAVNAALAALISGAAGAFAAPRLTSHVESVGGVVAMKVLDNAVDEPPPTPSSKTYSRTVGSEVSYFKVVDEDAANYANEVLAIWRDKSGNVMRIARPDKYPWGKDVKYKFGRKFGELRIYVDFTFAEDVTEAQAERLMREAKASMTVAKSAVNADTSSMKWKESSNDDYRFFTNLPRTRGDMFIKNTMKELSAMRTLYERYVPPAGKISRCTVRVFDKLSEYREYVASSASGAMESSIGLWNPSREELLVSAEDQKGAMGIMRHEGFHQYLHYAVPGRHATWFNEGHATFFENVKVSPDRSSAKVTDEGNRATWVSGDPARHAAAFRSIMRMTHDQFYSGDVNLHYCAAWALTYFLEKGVYTDEKLAPYRKVLPKYLELVAAGADGLAATEKAMEPVKGRDIASDFLDFWNKPKCRKMALKAK